ncbi:MAG: Hpt domain-containing protein [Paracoccaceae bacterium]|nr:Hpt domain-containing protein [Paracoccaceae bacterium]
MIDWTRVEELQDEIGPDCFDEVVNLFLAEAGDVVARLRDNRDPSRLAVDLHFLKGGVLNLGFVAVSNLCAEGESLASTGQGDRFDITALVATYEQSRLTFLTEYESRLAVQTSAG